MNDNKTPRQKAKEKAIYSDNKGNMNKVHVTEKRKPGRPRSFNSPEELQELLDAYIEYLQETGKPPTIAGLAYYTGLDRQTIYNYEKKADFFDTIKDFRDWVIMNLEETSITASGGGIVFLLKNYGYTDKQELDIKERIVYKSTASDMSDEELDKKLEEMSQFDEIDD